MYIVRPMRRSDEDTYGTAAMMLAVVALAVVPGSESVGGTGFYFTDENSNERRSPFKRKTKRQIYNGRARTCACDISGATVG